MTERPDTADITASVPLSRRAAVAGLTVAALTAPSVARAAQTERSVLITGCSSGFGRLAAEAFARRGWRTFATMRAMNERNRPAATELRALAAKDNLKIDVLDLDVTQDQSVARAIEEALARTGGRLDVAINNAGIGAPGPLELHSTDMLRAQFETNVIGPHRVMRAVAPTMRAQQSGLILQISSGLGRIVNPLMGSYCGTKWGLEGLSESLRYELAPFNVDVCIIEPGPYPTRFAANMQASLARLLAGLRGRDRARETAYADHLTRARAMGAQSRPSDPMEVVNAMVTLAEAPRDQRPLRTVVVPGTPAGQGPLDGLNRLNAQIQQGFLNGMGLGGWFR